MKSNSDSRPSALTDLRDGTWYFNYNIKEIDSEFGVQFEYDTIHMPDKTYSVIVSSLIRDRYALDEELSIQRQRDEKPDKFDEYYTYCEYCKLIAKKAMKEMEVENEE